jgi:hypothetical protein
MTFFERWLPAARTAIAAALALLAGASATRAAVLDDGNRVTMTLKDGTSVTLIGEATSAPGVRGRRYYYLPANLRLARRADGTPEFLFLKYTSERQGAASGGLIHFLMEWGLTPEQEAELLVALRTRVPDAEIAGPVQLEAGGDGGSFRIVSATLEDKTLAPATITSGAAPLVAGGRAAAASRLTPEGAQLLASTFEKARAITDLSIALNYNYVTLAPAAKGTITFDWSRLEREGQTLRAEYRRTRTGTTDTSDCFLVFCASSSRPEYAYSYNEVREQYRFLQEREIVKIQFDELVADERVAKIREAFFQYFLNTMAEKDDQAEAPPKPADPEKDKTPDIRQGSRYTFTQSSFKRAFASKTKRIDLNYRMSIRWPYQIVGNLASWYDGVRDNPKCVAAINLNDPFFQHRNINFILDADAKDMFESAINYVTINVRKTRSDGRPFEDRVTMDAKYVKDKGVTAGVTYARGEDRNPDAYEYQAQWSLRGGRVYPAEPRWERGTWEGVTLAAPVVSRTIEVEGDLAAMRDCGVTRIVVQIHYPRLGEEIEENIPISPAQNQPLVAKKIFMDRDARGYAYRLVVHHQKEGRLALPWSAKAGDDYVYAAIPEELLAGDSTLRTEAREAGKTIADSAKDKVLEKFKDLIGGVK